MAFINQTKKGGVAVDAGEWQTFDAQLKTTETEITLQTAQGGDFFQVKDPFGMTIHVALGGELVTGEEKETFTLTLYIYAEEYIHDGEGWVFSAAFDIARTGEILWEKDGTKVTQVVSKMGLLASAVVVAAEQEAGGGLGAVQKTIPLLAGTNGDTFKIQIRTYEV